MKNYLTFLISGLLFLIVCDLLIGRVFLKNENRIFVADCLSKIAVQKKGSVQEILFCESLERELFGSYQPIQKTNPRSFSAPAMYIDQKVRFLIFHNARELSPFGYCFFVFKGWFNPEKLSPEQLASVASGFAILKTELDGYKPWTKTVAGQACSKKLFDSFGRRSRNLHSELKDYISIIALNPIGVVQPGITRNAVLDELRLTLNHERVHAIQISCAKFKKHAENYWRGLSNKFKKQLAEKYSTYNWSNPDVTVLEAIAFDLEMAPQRTIELAKGCVAEDKLTTW